MEKEIFVSSHEVNEQVQDVVDCFPSNGLLQVQKIMDVKDWTFLRALNYFWEKKIKGQ